MTKGRPRFKITPEVLKQAEELAILLLNQKQIADCLGIALSTLMDKKKNYKEFSEAIKRGRAKGLAELAADLRRHQKNNPGSAIFKAKVHLKWREQDESMNSQPEVIRVNPTKPDNEN